MAGHRATRRWRGWKLEKGRHMRILGKAAVVMLGLLLLSGCRTIPDRE